MSFRALSCLLLSQRSAFWLWMVTMPRLSEADRAHVAVFVAVVGEALEESLGADASLGLLFDACKEVTGLSFIPLGTFDRLLRATGYKRAERRYGNRLREICPKDPAWNNRVWYW
ncbi:hypothetical protein SAZ11_39085 [Streptomyces sp. FXJ1.4098]|uniref:hypothetical protein n=1 Tax=Streptomyces sp. NPDC020845 TaxID=3365096 RepID=UPI00299C13CC|nr:hypothetical protein [Streptomyces sp. FXJ1.4098]